MDAHRTDLGELRRDMQVGFARIDELRRDMQVSFARIDGRLDTTQERFEKLLEKGLREQTRFFFLAWSVLLAAMIGLYARI